jgi:hypothetical protein
MRPTLRSVEHSGDKMRVSAGKSRSDRWARAGSGALIAAALLLGCSSDSTQDEAQGGSSSASGADTCSTAPALFTDTVWPSLNSSCVSCHSGGQVAAGTRLVFTASGASLQNYNVLRDYAKTSSDLLLSKSIGQPTHAGGRPYGDATSQNYANLASLIPVMRQSCTPSTSTPLGGQYWDGVALTSDSTALAKAAVLFAARNPTAAEVATASASPAALRQTIRGYMQGTPFNRFLDDVGDTHFLTPGVIIFGNNMGYNATDFPSAAALINNQAGLPAGERNRFQISARREPIELMKFIINNNRPWTDMVSANYTVTNGLIARYLNAQVDGAFVNVADDTEWRQATIPSQRLGGTREHAGVLSTHPWLQRFPTTPTNRNRHRVRMMYQQFLATDVSALAARPLMDDGQAFRVPTVENPACAACHDTIDPAAAGFQNWNEANRYLPNRTASGRDHALPGSYRSGNYPRDAAGRAYYMDGDNWFRDGKGPGFGSMTMPGGFTGNPTALQWLGQQVAADPRYALGAVHFWYEGVFGREPLKAPTDTTSPQYAGQLAAYNAQKEEFDQIAAAFRTDRGNGAYNVKDLLVDLVLSKWFRAERATNQSAARAVELADLGSANMLNPLQLNLKLQGLVGLGWNEFDNPYTGSALNYGDFDGNTRTVRAKSHTMMQTIIIDRMLAVRSCTFTRNDFDKPMGSRLLFPVVALTDTPATTAGNNAIVENIRHLHRWLLKEDLAASDPEIQRTLKLYTDVWNDRATPASRPVNCTYNNTNDPNYTGRAWAAVIAYLLGDAKFLYE